ncbi:MAG: polymerase sigma factor CnrH [Verrucomicrobiota bacterium]|jgi:RNA polymerase sigma-70 factor (ECF subfamily)
MTPAGDSPDEAALASAAAAGDCAAFERLAALHAAPLLRFLKQRMRGAHEAEDIAQQALIKAWQAMPSYNPKFRFRTWLWTIAWRLALSHYRRKIPGGGEGVAEAVADDSPRPDQIASRDGDGRLWEIARRELKPRQHLLLWLFYGEEMSLKEIAEVTGDNALVVRVSLHRARLALGRVLKTPGGVEMLSLT